MSEAGRLGACPVCSEPTEVAGLSTGEIFDCASCGTALEVLDVGPLQLAVAEEVEEEETSTEDAGGEFEDFEDDGDDDSDDEFDDDEDLEDD